MGLQCNYESYNYEASLMIIWFLHPPYFSILRRNLIKYNFSAQIKNKRCFEFVWTCFDLKPSINHSRGRTLTFTVEKEQSVNIAGKLIDCICVVFLFVRRYTNCTYLCESYCVCVSLRLLSTRENRHRVGISICVWVCWSNYCRRVRECEHCISRTVWLILTL